MALSANAHPVGVLRDRKLAPLSALQWPGEKIEALREEEIYGGSIGAGSQALQPLAWQQWEPQAPVPARVAPNC